MSTSLPPRDEMPREKLIAQGAGALTNAELLAIILRTGNQKQNVLELSRSFFSLYTLKSLSRLDSAVLRQQLGIGDAKACQIIACFELGRRLAAFDEGNRPQITCAADVARLFIPDMSTLTQEHVIGVYLDSRKRILRKETIFVGSLNESLIHPREIFKPALLLHAAAVIVLHNHPSGDPNPSSFDVTITKELVEAGELLGIPFLDHIIIGGNEYVSLKETGLV